MGWQGPGLRGRGLAGAVIAAWAWAWACLGTAWAEPFEDGPADDAVVVVAADASDPVGGRHLDRAAVEATPGRTADELLRAMPGIHLSAHGGRGKAYQYFLRGFDAVHGGDLAVSLEGVPLNEVSNVHAHGYLDLQLIPTVLVRSMDLLPGPARGGAGDFAVAGRADLGLGLDQGGGVLYGAVGSDRSVLATVAWRPEHAAPGTFVVVEGDVGGGVGTARGWRQARIGAGIEGDVGDARVRAWVLGQHGAFDSPGVLREDDVASGDVGFYDAYPGSGGGRSTRVLGAVQAFGGSERLAWRATAWGGWRALSLQQNFTGWYEDAVNGDGTVQDHRAWTAGAQGQLGWSPHPVVGLRAGLSARLDGVHHQEDGVTPDGTVWTEGEPLAARQADVGAWVVLPLDPTPWLHLEPAVRADVLLVDPDDDAVAWAPVVAPRLGVTLFEGAVASGHLAYGRGFRSPDARGASGGGRLPVAISDGIEAGVRASPWRWLALRVLGFATFVSDEIVFDHVAARFLATGATRRVGVDGGVSFRPVDAMRIDADLTWSDGRYTGSGDPIPYAPRVLGSVGLYVERLALPSMNVTFGFRTRLLGPRPLPEGYVAQPNAVVDLTAGVEIRSWMLTLDVDNLLATRWRDGEFVYASAWDPTAPRSDLSARHLTAGAPFALRLGVGWRF